VAQQVGAVGRDVDLELRVGDGQGLEERRAGSGIGIQLQNPLGVLAQLQLSGRAQHALGVLAADPPALQHDAAGERRADGRERIAAAGDHVLRAAHDRGYARAGVHLAQREPVGIGMARDLQHLADDHAVQVVVQRLHRVHGSAQHREVRPDLARLQRRAQEIRDPAQRGLHVASTNWAWNRMSASNNIRMSGMPYRTMAARSRPMPKAQPV
jgi:hypothetical protein